MLGIIIIISSISLAILIYRLIKTSIFKYILPILGAIAYGYLLFYMGMTINIIVFFVLSLLPLIILITSLNNKKI